MTPCSTCVRALAPSPRVGRHLRPQLHRRRRQDHRARAGERRTRIRAGRALSTPGHPRRSGCPGSHPSGPGAPRVDLHRRHRGDDRNASWTRGTPIPRRGACGSRWRRTRTTASSRVRTRTRLRNPETTSPARRLPATSPCGRPRSPVNRRGPAPGATGARAGTSSARPWPSRTPSARPSTSTAAASTSSSRTTRTRSRSPSARNGAPYARYWMHNGCSRWASRARWARVWATPSTHRGRVIEQLPRRGAAPLLPAGLTTARRCLGTIDALPDALGDARAPLRGPKENAEGR